MCQYKYYNPTDLHQFWIGQSVNLAILYLHPDVCHSQGQLLVASYYQCRAHLHRYVVPAVVVGSRPDDASHFSDEIDQLGFGNHRLARGPAAPAYGRGAAQRTIMWVMPRNAFIL